jgi:uncharacterized protein (TIGR00290 family)
MSWSSGKDSALALHTVRAAGDVHVTGLLSTVTAAFDRVSMHGVRRSLLQAQADALGLQLHVAELPRPCPNEEYERQMAAAVQEATDTGARHMIFGDLFLPDVRAYREQQLTGTGLSPLFPLWGRPTAALAQQMIELGLRAIITCLNPARVPAEFAGRCYDADLLADLPPDIDPCGEHGEFHTFVVDAPGFAYPVEIEIGETVERDGFLFTDVLPVGVQDGQSRVASSGRVGTSSG